ncbi:MAG TPA: glycine zipper domain-containing protein [Steroidobacteraceae bacterium]|jgi:pyruvate/2-oxoglutarate dehydrogenase complex dihydrolipoamide acyltransferase (E2) component
MNTNIVSRGLVASLLIMAASATAQQAPPAPSLAASVGVLAYPAKGQTATQQAADETECYDWSKTQSGYDPKAPPPAAAPTQAAAPQQSAASGARAKGAVRGAAAGAVIGEVADNDAGKGAAIGATAGVVAGGRQARKAQEQQKETAAAQQQASADAAKASQQALADTFKKGLSACLETKGYTVK